MGGYGSTRWNDHRKRPAAEDCQRFKIRLLTLAPGYCGRLSWRRGEEDAGYICYDILGDGDTLRAVRLHYTLTRLTPPKGEKDIDYRVALTKSPLPWGRWRYWFICPGMGCGRRVAALYRPPGQDYFACRHCHGVSYRTRQEGSTELAHMAYMGRIMADDYPNMTPKDWREVFKNFENRPPKRRKKKTGKKTR